MDGGNLDLMWNDTLINLVYIHSQISQLQTKSTAFVCTRDTTTIMTTYISESVSYNYIGFHSMNDQLHILFVSNSNNICEILSILVKYSYPTINEVSIPLSAQEVHLSTNLVGEWNIPGDTNSSSATADITFLEADTRLYTFT